MFHRRMVADVFEDVGTVHFGDLVGVTDHDVDVTVGAVHGIAHGKVIVFRVIDVYFDDNFLLDEEIQVVVYGRNIVETTLGERTLQFLKRQVLVLKHFDHGLTASGQAHVFRSQLVEVSFFDVQFNQAP